MTKNTLKWSDISHALRLFLATPEVQIRLRSPTAKIFFHSPLITAVSLASAHAYTAKRTNSPRKNAFRTQPRKNIHATKHFGSQRAAFELAKCSVCSQSAANASFAWCTPPIGGQQ